MIKKYEIQIHTWVCFTKRHINICLVIRKCFNMDVFFCVQYIKSHQFSFFYKQQLFLRWTREVSSIVVVFPVSKANWISKKKPYLGVTADVKNQWRLSLIWGRSALVAVCGGVRLHRYDAENANDASGVGFGERWRRKSWGIRRRWTRWEKWAA